MNEYIYRIAIRSGMLETLLQEPYTLDRDEAISILVNDNIRDIDTAMLSLGGFTK